MLRKTSRPFRTRVGKLLYGLRHTQTCDYCGEVDGKTHVVINDTRILPTVRCLCTVCQLRVEDKNRDVTIPAR